jgi:hypothetical protein
MPVLPEPELLVSELELPVLGELELGEALEPLEDEEPLAAPCSCRQRSFSVPVRESHWVLPAPTAGEVEVLPLALGEVVLLELSLALGEVVLLELPLALGEVVLPLVDDESAAMATAEAANSAVTAAVESTFNIVASPLMVREEACSASDAIAVPSARAAGSVPRGVGCPRTRAHAGAFWSRRARGFRSFLHFFHAALLRVAA